MNISENDPKKERQLLHDIGGQLIFMTLLREKNPDLIENWKRSFKNEDLSIER